MWERCWGWGGRERDSEGHEPCAFWRDVDIFVLHILHPKYDNMGAMAVTLAQTLGQNLGMMWNKHRSSAGISDDPTWPQNQPRPTPSSCRSEEGVCGRGQSPALSYVHLAHLPGDCKCPDSWLGCIMEDTG